MAIETRRASLAGPTSQETVRQETERIGVILDDLGHWIDTQLIATNSFVGWVIRSRARRDSGRHRERSLDKAS